MLKGAIVFDICDTLYNCNTTFEFLDYYFSKKVSYKLLNLIRKNLLFKILNKIIFKLFNIDLTRKIFFQLLKGKTKEELLANGEKFYEERLKKEMISETMELLKNYKKKGEKIILISASCDFIVEIIAKKLFVEEFFCSELNYKNGICTGELKKDILKIKKDIVINYGLDKNIEVVTDNIQDFDLVMYSSKAYIVINKKNKRFWEEKVARNKNIIFIKRGE